MNIHAAFINKTLDAPIYNESEPKKLKLIKYTKKQIKELCIDDLVYRIGDTMKERPRLFWLVKEMYDQPNAPHGA